MFVRGNRDGVAKHLQTGPEKLELRQLSNNFALPQLEEQLAKVDVMFFNLLAVDDNVIHIDPHAVTHGGSCRGITK